MACVDYMSCQMEFDGCCSFDESCSIFGSVCYFFFSSRRRHTRYWRDWSSDVCSSDLRGGGRTLAIGGIGGIIVILASVFFGVDLSGLTGLVNNVVPGNGTEQVDSSRAHENEEHKVLTLRVFNSCNEVWDNIFTHELHRTYQPPTLVTFTDQVQSACGRATSAVGPFYCPADRKVYVDLDFFNLLSSRFHAPGDLAMAYVTAHEVGHHVQQLLGLSTP